MRPPGGVTTLAHRPVTAPLLDELRAHLSSTGLRNVFNPSVLVGEECHVAFRALGPDGAKPFRAYWSRRAADGTWATTDLTAHAARWSVGPVADPKLFATSAGVFVSSNTGTPSAGPNDVHVTALEPVLGPPRACRLEGRARIEKNWAFFASGAGLRAVYGLRPLTVLETHGLDPRAEGPLTFRRAATAEVEHDGRDVSLGTQPVRAEDGSLLLVGHEKFWWRGRRGYVGRPVVVRGADGSAPRARIAARRLIHSVRDALPRLTPTHNPHLWSATYFAGLAALEDRYLLSYGVNDVGFGLALTGGETWFA